jgi:hypothetical protein
MDTTKLLGGGAAHRRGDQSEFEAWANSYYAITEGGTFNGTSYDGFTLINVNTFRDDRCTVAHEMIHAADLRLTIADHEPDPTNVFSGGVPGTPRTNLTPDYAEIVSKAYFASAR